MQDLFNCEVQDSIASWFVHFFCFQNVNFWYSGETDITNFNRGYTAQKLVKDSVLASRFETSCNWKIFFPSPISNTRVKGVTDENHWGILKLLHDRLRQDVGSGDRLLTSWKRKGKIPATWGEIPEVRISPAWCWFQLQIDIWFYAATRWNEKKSKCCSLLLLLWSVADL